MVTRRTLLLLFLVCTQAFGAFNYYSPLTVDHTKVPSTQTDFPILVSQTDNRFRTTGNGGHVQNSSGFDIRPYSDSGLTTALTFELERYDASTGEVIMWVKISSLSSSSDTVLYLAYGNSSLTTDGSSSSTWSNGFTRVYHVGNGTTLSGLESVNAVGLSLVNTPTAGVGQIDGGAALASASSQYLSNGSSNNTGLTAVTMSAWVKATSFPGSYNGVIQFGTNAGVYKKLLVKSTGKLACFVWASGDVSYDGTGTTTLSTGTWYYLTMTYDSSSGLIGYVNASQDKTVAANGNANSSSCCSAFVGNDNDAASRFWNGTIDEGRVSSVARSANWITTEYNNQNSPSTFETLGGEVNLGLSPGNWFMFFPR